MNYNKNRPVKALDGQFDVAIIGGGISGLSAAWELQKRGVDFVLLEANDRAGGRIKTVGHAGLYAEGGAMVITSDEEHCLGLMEELGLSGHLMELGTHGLNMCLGRKITSLTRLDGRVESWQDLRSLAGFLMARLRDSGSQLPLPTPGLFRAYRRALIEIERKQQLITVPYEPCEQPDWDAQSFADFLDSYHPHLKQYLDLQLKVTAGGLAREISTFWGMVTFQWNVVGHFYWVHGGTSQIPRVLMERLGPRVRLGADVSRVSGLSPSEVSYVSPEGNGLIKARAVLLATPPASALDICPELDLAKRQALAQVPHGAYIVVLLACDRRFWERDIPTGYMNCAGTVFADLVDGSRGQDRKEGILSCFIAGPEAAGLVSSTEEEIVSRTLADLEGLFPGCRSHVRENSVHIWPHAIPYFHPGYGRILNDLRRPQGNLFFCGDYTQGAGLNDGVMSAKIAVDSLCQWLAAH